MDVMFDRVAGLDIGKKLVTVCVRTPGPGAIRHSETRTFRTMTRTFELMRDWLVGEGVTLAAMESTSTYWKPVFCIGGADGALASQRRPHEGRPGSQDRC